MQRVRRLVRVRAEALASRHVLFVKAADPGMPLRVSYAGSFSSSLLLSRARGAVHA